MADEDFDGLARETLDDLVRILGTGGRENMFLAGDVDARLRLIVSRLGDVADAATTLREAVEYRMPGATKNRRDDLVDLLLQLCSMLLSWIAIEKGENRRG